MGRQFVVLIPLPGRINEHFELCRATTAESAASVVEALLSHDSGNAISELTVRVVPSLPDSVSAVGR